MVIGKASRRTFTLGDRVRVKVLRASLEQKLLDYQMIEKVAPEGDAAGAAAAGAAKKPAAKAVRKKSAKA